MKILVNLASEPFFGAVVETDASHPRVHRIKNLRQSGEELYAFFAEHVSPDTDIEWIGGLTGMGGFTNLRVAASIINSAALAYGCGVRGVGSGEFFTRLLSSRDIEAEVVLNSFGNNVFIRQGDTFTHVSCEEAVQFLHDKKMWVGALPESKAALFPHADATTFTPKEMARELFSFLDKQPDEDIFLPEYGFGAV